MLQKYDTEREEWQRKWTAAMWGVELKDSSPAKPNGRPSKQTMTAQDIMRNYGK